MQLYTIDEIAQKAGVAYSTVSYIFKKIGGIKAVKKEPIGNGSARKSYYSEDALTKVLEFREKQKVTPKKPMVVNPVASKEYQQAPKAEELVKKPLANMFNLLAEKGQACERCGDPAERVFGIGEKGFTLCEECRKFFLKVLSLQRVAFMPPEDEKAVAN